MKAFCLVTSTLVLSACSLHSSQDLKRAESLLKNFQCHNIENTHMVHSAITTYHQQALSESREKAQRYIQHYQQGDKLFELPLSEVIEEQYQTYQTACQALGGIYPKSDSSAQ